MKKLNLQRLRVGDIILTSGPNKVSKAVRRMTKSEISHAMVYVQHASVIDATAHGVHSSNLQRLFLEDDAVVVVLRHRTPLGEVVIRKVTDFARAATGTEYSKKEAMAVVEARRPGLCFCRDQPGAGSRLLQPRGPADERTAGRDFRRGAACF
jgi:hypothetical protein